jgi:hypothetical protein
MKGKEGINKMGASKLGVQCNHSMIKLTTHIHHTQREDKEINNMDVI